MKSLVNSVITTLCVLCIAAFTACKGASAKQSDMEEGIDVGVSACFGTLIDGKLIKAGGCNFPNDPLGKDSPKKYYKGIYAADPDSLEWSRVGSLPQPMAYGVTVTTPVGVALIGGATADGSLSDAWLLNPDATLSPLPSLPFTLDNAAGAAVGNIIFVAGGNADGKPSRALLMLDLDNTKDGWVKLTDMPGDARVQPVMAASKNADGSPCLYIFSGFAGRTENTEPTISLDGLCYDTTTKQWSALPAPTVDSDTLALAGGVAVTLPDGHIAACGGVNKDIFINALRNQAPDYLDHDIDWYRFNPYLLVFDPATSEWSVVSNSTETARAGATAVADGSSFYLIGGELKPRIRIASTLRITP